MDGVAVDGAVARFAQYVATLGRGPGRSRALTLEEARDAMGLLLEGAADPMQVGAFLMLLRYRGEDPAEMSGLVLGAQARLGLAGGGLGGDMGVALDWPSYGAGRTRGAPWFLLSALALGQAGVPVLMHGTNEFSGGMTVPEGLAALGLAPAESVAAVAAGLARLGFAYVPVEALCGAFAALLGLRRLFGLRSPMNTVARLLNPAGGAVRRGWGVSSAVYRNASGGGGAAGARAAAGAEGRRGRGGAQSGQGDGGAYLGPGGGAQRGDGANTGAGAGAGAGAGR